MVAPEEDCSVAASVKVAVRLRPMSERELRGNTIPVVNGSSERNEITLIKGAGSHQQRRTFGFDAVYTSFSTQGEVFKTVEPLVSDVLNGYEATVFAYGQTGTGKTYTMEGDISSDDQKGVIPRAVEAIFDRLGDARYIQSSVSASYLEIYNEELSDLLTDASSEGHSHKTTFGQTSNKNGASLMLVEDIGTKKAPGKGVFVKNLSEHEVKSTSDVLQLIQLAQERRRVGETKMNKHSSRSHCVFTLTVSSKRPTNDGGTMECSGKLNLVDLAGSECAKSAGENEKNTDRDRERKNINTSLLTLGRVISMLRNSESKKSTERIPYRDSKLTRLLQESLGGRCKTLLVATLSPSVLAVEETHSTLNYAQSAQGIMNKAVATSYIRMTNVKDPGAYTPREANENQSGGANVQDWHEMECRLAYMQSQLDEAQAALARKHSQQEVIVRRAEEAEKVAASTQARAEALESELEESHLRLKEATRQLELRAFFVAERVRTEERLSAQAREVLGCLEKTEMEACVLHSRLSEAVVQAEKVAELRSSFSDQSMGSLEGVKAELDGLGSLLAKQRGRAMNAVKEAAKVRDEHGSALRGLAEELASTGVGEVSRQRGELQVACDRAVGSLGESAEALRQQSETVVSAATEAQGAVSAQLERLGGALKQSEASLRGWAEGSEARQVEGSGMLRDGLHAVKVMLVEWKSEACARLGEVQGCLGEHTKGLEALLREVGEARKTEAQLVSLHARIASEHEEEGRRVVARARAISEAVESASEGLLQAAREKQLSEQLEMADGRLKSACGEVEEVLERQGATLSSALDLGREGNREGVVGSGIAAVVAAEEAAAAARCEEMAAQQEMLKKQQAELHALLLAQEEGREALRTSLMTKLGVLLEEELGKLGRGAESGVEVALEVGRGVGEACRATAGRVEVSLAEKVGMAEGLRQATTEWGRSSARVSEGIEEAMGARREAGESLVRGRGGVSEAHGFVREEMVLWARADCDCRKALGGVVSMGGDSVDAAAVAAEAQGGRLRVASELANELVERSAKVEVAGGEARKESEEAVGMLRKGEEECVERAGRAVEGVEEQLEVEARMRVAEQEALDSLLRERSAAGEEAARGVAKVKEMGGALVRTVEEGVRRAATGAAEKMGTQAQGWEEFAKAQRAVGEGVAAKLEDGRARAVNLVEGEQLASKRVVSEAEARVEGEEKEVKEVLGGASRVLGSMTSSLEGFVKESVGVGSTELVERVGYPYTGGFARSASEEEMEKHFGSFGAVPMAHEEGGGLEAFSPMRRGGGAMREVEEAKENAQPTAEERASLGAVALTSMKVGELRKMCDEHALPAQGSKSDLVLRLQAMISRIPTTPHRANSDQALLVAAAERLSAGRKSGGTRLPKALRRGGGGQALKDISA